MQSTSNPPPLAHPSLFPHAHIFAFVVPVRACKVNALRHDLDAARATESVVERQRQEHANMAADALGELVPVLLN